MRLRFCATTLRCAFVPAGVRCVCARRPLATFLRGSATMRLRMRLRFCGTTLRRAFVSGGLRCGCAWGRHGVTLLYASAGPRCGYLGVYAKLRYLFCADTSVRGGLKLRFCEVRLRCDCVSVRFCGFCEVYNGLESHCVGHERPCRVCALLVRGENAAGGSSRLHSELGVSVNELAESHALVSESLCEALLCCHGSCSR